MPNTTSVRKTKNFETLLEAHTLASSARLVLRTKYCGRAKEQSELITQFRLEGKLSDFGSVVSHMINEDPDLEDPKECIGDHDVSWMNTFESAFSAELDQLSLKRKKEMGLRDLPDRNVTVEWDFYAPPEYLSRNGSTQNLGAFFSTVLKTSASFSGYINRAIEDDFSKTIYHLPSGEFKGADFCYRDQYLSGNLGSRTVSWFTSKPTDDAAKAVIEFFQKQFIPIVSAEVIDWKAINFSTSPLTGPFMAFLSRWNEWDDLKPTEVYDLFNTRDLDVLARLLEFKNYSVEEVSKPLLTWEPKILPLLEKRSNSKKIRMPKAVRSRDERV